MALKLLNEAEYITEMNCRLRAHPEYEAGMEFMAHPPGATGSNILGIAWAGVAYRPAYMDVSRSMGDDFELQATQRTPH
jgi:hypothetical protein